MGISWESYDFMVISGDLTDLTTIFVISGDLTNQHCD
jgi:3',5'-cyclic AMP phosphodiesterase CpdA